VGRGQDEELRFAPEGIAAIGRRLLRDPKNRQLRLRAARLRFAIVEALFHEGRYENAVSEVKTYLAARRAEGERIGEAAALNLLGRISEMQGDIDDAAVYFRQGLRICEKLGMPYAEAAVSVNLGRLESNRYSLDVAEAHLSRAEALCRDGGFTLLLGEALELQCRLALRLGDLDRAESAANEMLELVQRRQDRARECVALHEVGQVAMRRTDFETADARFKEALTIAQGGGFVRQVGILRNALGNCAINRAAETEIQGDDPLARRLLAEARLHIERSLDIARELRDPRMEGCQSVLLGAIAWRGGDGVLALRHLQQGLTLARKVQNMDDMGLALLILGMMARSFGRLDEARNLLQQSLTPLFRARRGADMERALRILRELNLN
jgi:tetratricopeptide (TPR) repeat protein